MNKFEVRWTDRNVTLHEHPHGKQRSAYCVTRENAEALAHVLRAALFVCKVEIIEVQQ